MSFLIALALAAPATSSPLAVCDLTWTDAARTRAVPVRVRMPAGGGRVPLVIFSHGLGGSLDGGTAWGQAWAASGIGVIHVQHPGSDTNLWRAETTPAGRLAALERGKTAAQLLARVADVRFVLDEVARPGSAKPCGLDRIDMTRVGVAGHSFGAVTVQALAGQRFAGGRSLGDPRIKAALAMSPSAPQQGTDAQAFGAITIPFMSMTGTADEAPGAARGSAADRVRPFEAMPAGGKYLVVFDGADHMIFNGHALRRAARAGDAAINAATASLSTEFFKANLMADKDAQLGLTRAFAKDSPIARIATLKAK